MNPVPDMSFPIIKMLAALMLVIGLLVIIGRMIKSGRFGRAFSANHTLRLVGAMPLGMKKSIALVKVADRILIIGIGGERLQLLDTVDDPHQVEIMEQGRDGSEKSFGGCLKKIIGQQNRPDKCRNTEQ